MTGKQKQEKDFIKKLNEVLSLLDPEQMIRDGIEFFKFNHREYNKSVLLKVTDIKKLKRKRRL